MKKVVGFSLVELIVVISVLGILAAVVYANLNQGSAQSRDAKRQADLRNLQSAIELYKQNEGRYPPRCDVTGQNWSGQKGTNFECNNGTGQYIEGLAPKYIRTLPVDPKLNGVNSGYVYTVNADGTVYKLMAKNTVERKKADGVSGYVDYNHPFKSCDATDSAIGMCDATQPSNNKPSWCQEADLGFQTSYAVWGGYANASTDAQIERFTEDIICDIQ